MSTIRISVIFKSTATALLTAIALAIGYSPAQNKKQDGKKPVGVQGPIGCLKNPKKIDRLIIDKPGVYENYLVDSNWQGGNRVKITADKVTLRHCEIMNASGNGVGVFAK